MVTSEGLKNKSDTLSCSAAYDSSAFTVSSLFTSHLVKTEQRTHSGLFTEKQVACLVTAVPAGHRQPLRRTIKSELVAPDCLCPR